MKKSIIIGVCLIIGFTALISCNSSINNGQNVGVLSPDTSQTYNETDTSTPVNSVDEGNTVIEYEESACVYSFTEYFDKDIYSQFIKDNPGDYDELDLTEINELLDIQMIVDQIQRYYICNNTANNYMISVFDKSYANNEDNIFEAPFIELANQGISKDQIGFYESYEALNLDFLHDHRVICMRYVKEGVNIYALQFPTGKEVFDIVFCIDGVCFEVSSPVYRYTSTSIPYTGYLPTIDDNGKIKDGKDYFSASKEVFELCDPTTQSSAIVKALKAAVANKK